MTNANDPAAKADRAYLAGMARAADGRVIMARSDMRIANVTAELFAMASRDVSVLADDLDGGPYGSEDVRREIVGFLEREPRGRLRIAVRRPPDPSGPFSAAVAPYADRVRTVVIDVGVPRATFAVADASSFRFEAGDGSASFAIFGEEAPALRLQRLVDAYLSNRRETTPSEGQGVAV